MKTITTMILTTLLIASGTASADKNGTQTPEGASANHQQWQTFDASMSPADYRDAVRSNQKQVRRFVKTYSSDKLRTLGVPKAGVAVLGAAAGLAVDGDARLNLNKSKSLAFTFDDVVSDDRAVMFRFRKRW